MTEPTLYRKFANLTEIEEPPEGVLLCWVVPVDPDYRSLADALHHALCRQSHIDQCGYYYHQWNQQLPDWHPKHEWLKKAQAVFNAWIGGDDED